MKRKIDRFPEDFMFQWSAEELARLKSQIVISSWGGAHRAPPHFHAEYGEHEALVEIESLAVYAGSLPNRPLAFVRERATLHRDELRQDWTLARTGRAPGAIAPLE